MNKHPSKSYARRKSGGIGAIVLAIFAGSLLGVMDSFTLVLSHTSNAEEELRARFGEEYVGYAKKVPKIFPNVGIK